MPEPTPSGSRHFLEIEHEWFETPPCSSELWTPTMPQSWRHVGHAARGCVIEGTAWQWRAHKAAIGSLNADRLLTAFAPKFEFKSRRIPPRPHTRAHTATSSGMCMLSATCRRPLRHSNEPPGVSGVSTQTVDTVDESNQQAPDPAAGFQLARPKTDIEVLCSTEACIGRGIIPHSSYSCAVSAGLNIRCVYCVFQRAVHPS